VLSNMLNTVIIPLDFNQGHRIPLPPSSALKRNAEPKSSVVILS